MGKNKSGSHGRLEEENMGNNVREIQSIQDPITATQIKLHTIQGQQSSTKISIH